MTATAAPVRNAWRGVCAAAVLWSVAAGAQEVVADPLRRAAQEGDVPSQSLLADEFFFGRNGRQRNPTLAVFWYRRAAESGDAAAMYNLAVCLEHGWGTEADRIGAFRYYTRAAGSVSDARLRRALLLWSGIPDATEESGRKRPGIPADRAEALRELDALAASGHAGARFELASLLFNDSELRASRGGELRLLLEPAAEAGDPAAMRMLADCWRFGFGGGADIHRARFWWERAAEAGDPAAMVALAGALEFGQGGAPEPERAFEWIRRAAEAGNPRALVRLGEYHLQGDYTRHDPAAAVGCFQRALAAEEPSAATRLGDCALHGIGMEPDPQRAAEFYGRAARGGDPDGQFKFGRCYLDGTGMAADPVGAVFWFRRAAGRGQTEAMRELGLCLLSGRGVARDEAEGSRLLQAAASAGDAEARLLLDR